MRAVLLVDDHAAFRAFARDLIKAAGYRVVAEAANGAAALAAAAEYDPEIVVLDIRLPDMSGLEVARRLASGSQAPVVILISSGDAREYARVALESGARGFIAKVDLTEEAFRSLAGPA